MKLIIPTRIADNVEPHLPAIAPGSIVVHVDEAGATDGDLYDAEVYLRWWDREGVLRRVLAAAPQLRWLHTPSAGVDHVLIPELLDRNLLVTNSAGAHDIRSPSSC